jgi:hypothetical protein
MQVLQLTRAVTDHKTKRKLALIFAQGACMDAL